MSVEVVIDTSEVDRFFNAMSDLGNLPIAIGAAAAEILADHMKDLINVDTGTSRDSITIEDYGTSWNIGPHSGYSGYFNDGTSGPYDIFPKDFRDNVASGTSLFGKSALRWVDASGRVIFAKHVVHPGIEGSHFIENTIETSGDEIRELASAAIQEFFSGI